MMKITKHKIVMMFIIILAIAGCKNKNMGGVNGNITHGVTSSPDTVWMTGVTFQPETIVVNKGDTIVWVNTDIVAHNVTVLPNQEWTSGNIKTDGMWKMAIENSFDYFCSIHPPMKGSVEVR